MDGSVWRAVGEEHDMQISYLRDLLEASVLCGEDRLEEDVSTVFASDMMSDVLACPDEIQCLLTGLINSQVIRTADMMLMILMTENDSISPAVSARRI